MRQWEENLSCLITHASSPMLLVSDRRLDLLHIELHFRGERHDSSVEGNADDVVHRLDKMKLHLLANISRDLFEIALVVSGKNDARDSGTRRGENLVLHTADRQHFAAQSDLAGHRHIAMDGSLRHR